MQLNASLLGALRCFQVAARHHSFTRAAAELHCTPGAVSQQIRLLEARLDCPLFQRLPRGLQVTDAGERLLTAVSEGMGRIEAGLSQLRPSSRPLLVSCSPSFALLWLMPRLHAFQREHPGIEIKLLGEFQGVDRSVMVAGGMDAAIRFDPVAYAGLHVTTLLDEYLLPVASSQYVQQHPTLTAEGSLADCQLLHDTVPWEGAQPYAEWDEWLRAARPGAPQAAAWAGQEFNLSLLALGAARAHQGICLGRAALVQDDLRSGALVDVFGTPVRAAARYVLLSANPEDARLVIFSRWLVQACEIFARERLPGTVGAGTGTGTGR